MARYFAGNTLAAFSRTSTSIVEITSAGRFDSNFVPNAIALLSGDTLNTYTFVSSGVLWVHFEYYAVVPGAGNQFVTLYSSSTPAYRLVNVSGTAFQMQYWNGTAWVNVGASVGYNVNTILRLDLKVTPNNSMELFAGGASIASGSGISGGQSTITQARFSGLSTSFPSAISQVLIADFDTRDSRYRLDQPTAIGALADGSGLIGDVTETVLDESTSWALTTSGQRRSGTHAALTPPTGYQVAAVCLSARGRTNGTGPTDAKLGLRKTAEARNYVSPALSLNTGYEPRGAIWETDPGTASDWTTAGYNDTQMFVEAV